MSYAEPSPTCACLLLGALGALGCRAMPPPPILPMHAGTEAQPRDTTTAMLVVGIVHAGRSILSGASGFGVAVRVEHQAYGQTALGVQLGGGHGSDGGDGTKTLIAVDAYGRRSLADWTAATYSVGLSWFSTGLWTLSGHAGIAASIPNDHVVPVLRLGVAAAVPIVPGAPFGDDGHGTTDTASRPTSQLFVIGNAGLVVPVGDTGNRASLDLGFAHAPWLDQSILELSAADAQR